MSSSHLPGDDTTIFGEAMAARGLFPLLSSHAERAPLLERIRRAIGEELAELGERRNNKPRKVLFGYLADDGFGAYSLKHPRHPIYCIGMKRGAAAVIADFFGMMLSHPNLFPDIGTPTREATVEADLAGGIVATLQGLGGRSRSVELQIQNPVLTPYCDDRCRYTLRLFLTAVEFIVLHETSHVTGGHLDYPEAPRDSGFAAEVEMLALSDATPGAATEAHLREVDADRTAAGIFATSLLQNRKSLIIRDEYLKVDQQELADTVCFALLGLFVLEADQARGASWTTHPSPDVRLAAVVDGVYANLVTTDQALADGWRVAFRTALRRMSDAGAELHIPAPAFRLSEELADAAEANALRLVKQLPDLHQRLRPYDMRQP